MKTICQSGYICHPCQLYTVRRVTVAEGKSKGMDVIEVCTADGLQVDILPDTGLDIGQVRYKGTPSNTSDIRFKKSKPKIYSLYSDSSIFLRR